MTILGLWLPIIVSAVIMFFASFLIWAVFNYHNRDFSPTGDEEAVRAALKGSAPGFYIVPFCLDPAEAKKPEVRQKLEEGPLAYITVGKSGMPNMAPRMVQMFAFFVLVGVLCAYFVSRTLAPDAEYLSVFRVAGTVVFIANSFAVVPLSIWFDRPWSMTVKDFIDALIYAVLAGGVFGWLA
jgi:hypothetical protein